MAHLWGRREFEGLERAVAATTGRLEALMQARSFSRALAVAAAREPAKAVHDPL